MVDFVQLQRITKELLERDRAIKTIGTEGPTVEAAVTEAAILLGVPVRRLEYEIIEHGSSGFLGVGKRIWKIKAYEKAAAKKKAAGKAAELVEQETEQAAETKVVIEDRDGEVFVHLTFDGAFVKVTQPVGKGKKADEKEARKKLEARFVKNIKDEVLVKTIEEAKGEYVKVGEFDHNTANDSIVNVEIGEDEMKAWLTVTQPGQGGCDVTEEGYVTNLKNYGITNGIKEDFLKTFADNPVYKKRVLAAEGTEPVNGRDAYIKYNFQTDQSQIRLKESSDGKVNFKDLNIIQNVVENQPLGKKIAPEKGVPGHTVTGKFLDARDGRDIELPLGNNVHAGEDGITIISDINGQVLIVGSKVNVEPVYEVDGDVNLETGNIAFLGTVLVKGNVEDGFSIKASGNIEVKGSVGKAELDAEGDIIVHQGIIGKGGGLIKTDRSVWAKFIENASIEAGGMVTASDGIINSKVDASKRIVCQGKRAHIVGGRLRAAEEINAKVLGNAVSGTETICEVGIDPKTKTRFEALSVSRAEKEKQMEEMQKSLQSLINIKKQRKSLPPDKEAYMTELMEKRQTAAAELRKIYEELNKLQKILDNANVRGRVSASDKVYPGVKVFIRDAVSDIRTEYKSVTFSLDNNLIRAGKYEAPEIEAKKETD
ncbi:MAG: polymerase/DUF342 domain-containing protein [Treponematales bacterium]